MSSFPTLSSSSPGAIKMRFPNSREGDAALPRGGGKGQKKFCVPPRVTRRGAWLGTGRTGCGCVQHPSERGRVKPHLPGAPRFLGKKKKKDAVRRGLAGCEVSPGLLRAGMARCAGSTAPGQFSLPVFFLLLFLLYLSSLHRKSPSPRVPAAGWQPVTFTNPFSSRVRSSAFAASDGSFGWHRAGFAPFPQVCHGVSPLSSGTGACPCPLLTAPNRG